MIDAASLIPLDSFPDRLFVRADKSFFGVLNVILTSYLKRFHIPHSTSLSTVRLPGIFHRKQQCLCIVNPEHPDYFTYCVRVEKSGFKTYAILNCYGESKLFGKTYPLNKGALDYPAQPGAFPSEAHEEEYCYYKLMEVILYKSFGISYRKAKEKAKARA